MKRFIPLLTLILCGCGSPPVPTRSSTHYEPPPVNNSGHINTVLPAWVGHKASELIAVWGKPTKAGEATKGSYQGRGGISFSYTIGDKGSVIDIPETSAYTDATGTTHVYDSSTIVVPHVVNIFFVADLSGVIINASWFGTFTDKFDPQKYPMPTTTVELPFPVKSNYESTRQGGNWSLPTAEEKLKDDNKVTPDNIAEKLKELN